jgi:hypothetical protein
MGLLLDAWDNLYLYTWHVGTLDKHYLWTNLSNLQKDNVSYDEDTYKWSTDEKENILGRPGWDSNDSYVIGYAGDLPWLEEWNFGFMYNYQTSDLENRTDNADYSVSYSGSDVTDYYYDTWEASDDDTVDHLWMLSAGRSLNENLTFGVAWYHWYNDRDITSSNGSYTATYFNGLMQDFTFNEELNEYYLEEDGDTVSLGINLYKEDWYFQLLQCYIDLDYNQTTIDWSKKVINNTMNEGSQTKTEGKDLSDFAGNEDRSDFGFDLLLRGVRKWDGDFWKKTFVWAWLGFHPEDGDYTADKVTRSYIAYPNNYEEEVSAEYDIDGVVDWDELNAGFLTKSFMNFGERVLFAWGIQFEWWDYALEINYDNIVYYFDTVDDDVKSSVTSYKDHVNWSKYCWSFPVALEVSFLKNLVGRVGAKWSLTDLDMEESFSEESGSDEDNTGSSHSYWFEGNDDFTDSKTSSTSYSFGLGWRFNEYLQLDLTSFTDLDDMNEWQLSATLIW